MSKRTSIEAKLIAAGVRNLKEFGYEFVTPERIMTDMVYAKFFRSMLEDNKGHGFDTEINALIAEIDRAGDSQ